MSLPPKLLNNQVGTAGRGNIPGVIPVSAEVVPPGQLVPDLSLESFLAMIRLLAATTGIVRAVSSHHAWNLLLHGGSIALIEEEAHFIPTLTRKLKALKVKISLKELEQKPGGSLHLYQYISQILEQNPDSARQVLKEILFENLLAIHLEDRFSFTWHPLRSLPQVNFPVWQLPVLEEAARRAVTQWQEFIYVRHPYQRIQLIDAEDTIAQVPLFAGVTTGKHRICEIADKFKQHVSRTAAKLDKLAEKRTISILPLTIRPDEVSSPVPAAQLTPKVFVVDDSAVLLRQFGDLLKNWGYEVALSHEAIRATEDILAFGPDVVFLDINMPGLSGFELIKQLRRQPALVSLPLVLVTSENNVANSFRARWAHCRFLAKPRSPEDTHEFREQLRAVLRELAPLPSDPLV